MAWNSKEMYTHKLIYNFSLIVINSLAVIMNGLFVILFVRFHRKLLTKNNTKLLLSMAIADLLVGTTGVTTGVLFVTNQSRTVYKLLGTLPLFSCMYTSLISLSVMNFDRLISMKCALRYNSLMSQWRICKLIAFSWIGPIILTSISSIIYLVTNTYVIELKFRNILLTICFIFGFTVLLVSNRILYYSICQQRRKLHSLSVNYDRFTANLIIRSNVDTQANAKSRRSLNHDICLNAMVFWIVNIFIICWLPLTLYRFTYLFGRKPILWLGRLSMCLATSNSVLNPCIYIIKRRDFRKYIKQLFKGS